MPDNIKRSSAIFTLDSIHVEQALDLSRSSCGHDTAELFDPFASQSMQQWVIRFSSGRYFQHLKIDVGGPLESAMVFFCKQDIDEFMLTHSWIHHGGMYAVCIDSIAT